MDSPYRFPLGLPAIPLFLVGIVSLCMLSPGSSSAEVVSIATGEYPPWTSKQLPHEGVVSHVVAESFKEAGIQVKFHYYPWSRSYDLARLGRHNAASYWACSEERQKDFYCSTPIIEEQTVFFHLKTSTFKQWDTIDDLKGYKIGATSGYTYSKDFWEAANSKRLFVDTVSEDEQSFRMLLVGRVDLSLMGKIAGLGLLRSKFNPAEASLVIYNPHPLIKQQMSLLFPKSRSDSLQLLFLFNRGFEKLRKSGLYDQYLKDLAEGKYDHPYE